MMPGRYLKFEIGITKGRLRVKVHVYHINGLRNMFRAKDKGRQWMIDKDPG